MEPTDENKVIQLLNFSDSEKKLFLTFENCCLSFSNLIPLFNQDPQSLNPLFETLETIKAKDQTNEKVIRGLFEKHKSEKEILQREISNLTKLKRENAVIINSLSSEFIKKKEEHEKSLIQIAQDQEKARNEYKTLSNNLANIQNENDILNNDLRKIKKEKETLEVEVKKHSNVISKKDEDLNKLLQHKKELREKVRMIRDERDEILIKNKKQSDEIYNLNQEKLKLENIFNETQQRLFSSTSENQTFVCTNKENQSMFDCISEKIESLKKNCAELKSDNLILESELNAEKKKNENLIKNNQQEIEEIRIEAQKKVEIKEKEETKLENSELKKKYKSLKKVNVNQENQLQMLIIENQQLKNGKNNFESQIISLEQQIIDLKATEENYISLQKSGEQKIKILIDENETLRNEKINLTKNLEQPNISESRIKILEQQINDLKKMEENYISLELRTKMLLAENETLKNEKNNLNLKIRNLEQQIKELNTTESIEKFNSQRSLQFENEQKCQNFINVEKISETEFSVDILDQSISNVIFETANNPMVFNFNYKRDLSAVFSDPNSLQKSRHLIKEHCFVEFSLDQQNIFKFDKLDERRIKKYSERIYHIKYIYSGSFISKKSYDKDKKPNFKKPESDLADNIIHNSIDSETLSLNQETQKKELATPRFSERSHSIGSSHSSQAQKAEECSNKPKDPIKKKKIEEEKTETLNETEEGKKETCENGKSFQNMQILKFFRIYDDV